MLLRLRRRRGSLRQLQQLLQLTRQATRPRCCYDADADAACCARACAAVPRRKKKIDAPPHTTAYCYMSSYSEAGARARKQGSEQLYATLPTPLSLSLTRSRFLSLSLSPPPLLSLSLSRFRRNSFFRLFLLPFRCCRGAGSGSVSAQREHCTCALSR